MTHRLCPLLWRVLGVSSRQGSHVVCCWLLSLCCWLAVLLTGGWVFSGPPIAARRSCPVTASLRSLRRLDRGRGGLHAGPPFVQRGWAPWFGLQARTWLRAISAKAWPPPCIISQVHAVEEQG